VSRRGLLAHMYSDNGTNFHGTDRELQTSFRAMSSDPTLQITLTSDSVQWHFIPPAASLFGTLRGREKLSFICGQLLVRARFPWPNL